MKNYKKSSSLNADPVVVSAVRNDEQASNNCNDPVQKRHANSYHSGSTGSAAAIAVPIEASTAAFERSNSSHYDELSMTIVTKPTSSSPASKPRFFRAAGQLVMLTLSLSNKHQQQLTLGKPRNVNIEASYEEKKEDEHSFADDADDNDEVTTENQKIRTSHNKPASALGTKVTQTAQDEFGIRRDGEKGMGSEEEGAVVDATKRRGCNQDENKGKRSSRGNSFSQTENNTGVGVAPLAQTQGEKDPPLKEEKARQMEEKNASMGRGGFGVGVSTPLSVAKQRFLNAGHLVMQLTKSPNRHDMLELDDSSDNDDDDDISESDGTDDKDQIIQIVDVVSTTKNTKRRVQRSRSLTVSKELTRAREEPAGPPSAERQSKDYPDKIALKRTHSCQEFLKSKYSARPKSSSSRLSNLEAMSNNSTQEEEGQQQKQQQGSSIEIKKSQETEVSERFPMEHAAPLCFSRKESGEKYDVGIVRVQGSKSKERSAFLQLSFVRRSNKNTQPK